MINRSEKKNYLRNVEVGLIASLAILISVFKFFPDISFLPSEKIFEEKVTLVLEDVPITIQSPAKPGKSKPSVPVILIQSEIEEPEILSDVEIDENNFLDDEEGNGKIAGLDDDKVPVSGFFNPRQVLEVLPKDKDGFNGRIELSLKLNEEGEVTAHKILSNTTNSDQCLEEVLKAAYKSKWEPFLSNQKEFWVEKSYVFN